jgi:SAM-dependent methyltransferase
MLSKAGAPYKFDASREAYLVREACPLCGAPTAESIRKLASNPPAESLSPPELGPLLQGYASGRIFFTYHQCRKCGLLYCPVFFSQEQLDFLYSHQPENIADAPVVARARTQEAYFDILSRYSPLNGDYLEIGCDIGLFTELARTKGQLRKLWLYEPNLTVHTQLADRLAGVPHVIRTDAFKRDHVTSSSLSTAVMIHVIDHLLQPRQLLKDLRDSLAPGGIVMMVTHDYESALARLLGRRWPPYTLQHPQLFSRLSMHRMLSVAGFETLTIVKTKNFFPAAFIARGALSVLGLTLPKVLDWSWPLLGLRFGNIAAVGRRL